MHNVSVLQNRDVNRLGVSMSNFFFFFFFWWPERRRKITKTAFFLVLAHRRPQPTNEPHANPGQMQGVVLSVKLLRQ